MNDVWSTLGAPLIVWVLTGVLAWCVTLLSRSRKREEQRLDALCSGVRSLLRNELLRTHREVTVHGGATIADKEWAERNWLAYEALDGNGTGKALHADIMAADVILESK